MGKEEGSLEDVVISVIERSFWKDKKVFITGHTGFKGAWLSLWLHSLGAQVTGYALRPPTNPSLFELGKLEQLVHSIQGDIRNKEQLFEALLNAKPEIVIHMAAQPLVRESYNLPVETYEINVMGTVHLLEAVKNTVDQGIPVKAVINVTTDKCYENKEWPWGYREYEQLGGYDPYSNSKACSELVTLAYRKSYFNPLKYAEHGVALATARAGNVIGGGDWANDRLVPDCIQALLNNEKVMIRNPHSYRPWQYVLEPLSGYLILAQKLAEHGIKYAEGWNFGPSDGDAQTVEAVVKAICAKWGSPATYEIENAEHPHEAHYLKLDCSKARSILGWRSRWNFNTAIDKVVEWTEAYRNKQDLVSLCLKQIEDYTQEVSLQ